VKVLIIGFPQENQGVLGVLTSSATSSRPLSASGTSKEWVLLTAYKWQFFIQINEKEQLFK
jgi:hypothetical protein